MGLPAPVARLTDGMRRLFGGGLQASPTRRGGPSSQYMRGERSSTFFGWQPILRDQREDVRAAYWRAAARTIDSIQNSGWLAGAVQQAVASTMGTGLRLASKPEWETLGWEQEESNAWARAVERRWEAWAANPLECDAAGKFTMAQLGAAVLRSYFAYGEALGVMAWIGRSCSTTRTKVQLFPAHRMTQEGNGVDMFQGVRVDDNGLPLSYRLQLTQPLVEVGEIIEVRARDEAARPIVLHIFDGEAGQMRGISPMTPALRVVRQFDQLSDATLTAALIQTIFAATVQSSAPTQDILNALRSEDESGTLTGTGSLGDYMGARGAWYDNTKIDLGGLGRIAHLFPGEQLDFKASETPNGNYESFAKFLLREIARCLGMSFETLTGDYTSATYSSVRMSTSEIWPIILWRRQHIVGRFYQAVFEAWLEEDIDAGRTPFPGGVAAFVALRAAACRADWRGPPKPQADDLKTAKAHETWRGLGVLTDEAICSDLGADWEDVYEQRAREMKLRKKLDLPDPTTPVQEPVADKLVTQPDNA